MALRGITGNAHKPLFKSQTNQKNINSKFIEKIGQGEYRNK